MDFGAFIARALGDRGVTAAFGAPTPAALPLHRGLAAAGLRLTRARGHRGAALMAEGYARATGKPGVCIVPARAGRHELGVAMDEARVSGAPLLVLSVADGGDGDDEALATIDAMARFSARPENADEALEALEIAFTLFAASRPGPIHLALTPVLMALNLADPHAPSAPATPAPPTEMAVAAMARRLDAAKAPILLFGDGALTMGAAKATALAELLGAPTLLTASAAGLLPPGHPLRLGGWLGSATVARTLAAADAVLCFGCALDAPDWRLPPGKAGAAADAKIIRVDRDETRLQGRPGAMIVAADPGAVADALLDGLAPRRRNADDVTALRAEAAAETPPRYARHLALIEALWETLPDALVVADPCQPGIAGALGAAPPAPRRWWTSAVGRGAPGYALSSAIGAKAALPRRPVVALTDEMGAMVAVAELAAAAHAHLNVIFMVWNDSGGSDLADTLRAMKLDPEPSSIDFNALARSFGANYLRVTSPRALAETLRAAAAKPAPTLIELREEFWEAA